MRGKRVIFVGAVHEAVPALGVLLDSGVEIAEVVTLPAGLRDYPHPRSSQALRERAVYWGRHIGRPGAEPFAILREVTCPAVRR
jgi:hypothetical protein